MKRATIFTEDDVRAYPVDTDWCLAYQARQTEERLDNTLFALHEIYCLLKIEDYHWEQMSEEQQQQYACERSAAMIAKQAIEANSGRILS